MNQPNQRVGGTNSYKLGDLKRRLDPVIVAIFDPNTGTTTPTINRRLVLKGMSGDINIQIAAAPVGRINGGELEPIDVPAGAATMQLTPVVWCGSQPKIYLRPVFQDPAAANPHSNNPLPQDLPFGWEFSTEADEVYIDLVIDATAWVLGDGSFSGSLLVQVTVEYNGQWWDTKAIQAALGQVQLTGTGQPDFIQTVPS